MYGQNTGFSQSVVITPAGGDALVKSELVTIYYNRAIEAFYAAADTYCTGITWVPQGSWENTTGAAQSFTYQYTTELKITQGSEVTAGGLNLGATFKDFAMTIDASTKTFSANETTTPQTTPLAVAVAPGKKATLYQRQYDFRTDMYFVLDSARVMWNAGAASGDGLARKECTVQIMSGDYLVTEQELSNAVRGTVQVKTVARANKESDRQTRKRGDLTTRAKNSLAQMGI